MRTHTAGSHGACLPGYSPCLDLRREPRLYQSGGTKITALMTNET